MLRVLKEGTSWANREELYVGLLKLKEKVRKDTKEKDLLLAFWGYGVKWKARAHNIASKNLLQLHGSNIYVELTSEEGRFSNLCQCGCYNWWQHRENAYLFPSSKETLGRALWIVKGVGIEID